MKRVAAMASIAILACSPPQPRAGRVTAENAEQVLLSGSVADGAVGDYFLRNEHVVAIIQRPGRVFSVGPYGGNLIDFGDAALRADYLGETIPFIQMGLTAEFTEVRVVDDGSAGGAAVLEAEGEDAIWDFLTLESLSPLLRYHTNEDGTPGGLLPFDPTADLPLKVRARYRLEPGAKHVEVRYFLRNPSAENLDLRVGFALDMRGAAEPFTPGPGFTDPGAELSHVVEMLTARSNPPFLAYQADDCAIGVRPFDPSDRADAARVVVAVVGVAIVAFGVETPLALLDSQGPVLIAPGEEHSFGFHMGIGRDVGDIKTWAEGDDNWGTLRGRVVDQESGTGIAEARVAALDPTTGDVVDAWVTGTDGSFGGSLPAGTYHVAADDLRRPPDPGELVEVTERGASEMTIPLAPSATVRVEVQSANRVDEPDLEWTPCRVLLLGAAPERAAGLCEVGSACVNHEPFRHRERWELGPPVPYAQHLLTCNTTMAPDAPLQVTPGKYVVVVSRGPEYDTMRELVDLAPGDQARIAGVLHRVVDSTGYAAADFHVHQVRSPDSLVAFEDRLKSFAAVGIDFFATTDHDSITDLRPLIDAMGLEHELTMVPGQEVSTMDIGHFNGFPFEPIAGLQDGGAVDWAGGRHRPTPPVLFARMRERGAQIVQVNHPRDKTAYFDAVGLHYDLDRRIITHDPEVAPPPEIMHMQSGLPLFAPTFDAIEIYNGVGLADSDESMRDWFNFLSMGFSPTGTAVSDSHDLHRRCPGEPRTYIRVENDRPPLLDVDELIASLRAGRAFGSSGPFLEVTAVADGVTAGSGELLTPAPGDIEVRVHVETPGWYEVSIAEIFVTQTYVDDHGDSQSLPLTPTMTVPLAPSEILRANGGLGLTFDTAVVLPSAGVPDGDGWVVVRVRGPGSTQLPVALSSGGIMLHADAATAEALATFSGGEPFAFSNPVFFDRDGNGRYDPPFPLQ